MIFSKFFMNSGVQRRAHAAQERHAAARGLRARVRPVQPRTVRAREAGGSGQEGLAYFSALGRVRTFEC